MADTKLKQTKQETNETKIRHVEIPLKRPLTTLGRSPSCADSRAEGHTVMMRPDHIRAVQATWLKVLPVQEATARLFYERLFEMDPSLKGLFRSDMRRQAEKLMQVMDAAINGLAMFEQIRPSIQELGRRHADYGVKDHHYGTVGTALLWALGESLGAEFTPQVRHAWITVYGALAATMREAASGAAHDAHRPVRLVEVAAAASGPNPRDAA